MAEDIPLPNVAQDSWAWHDNAQTRGLNYFAVHKDDDSHADMAGLRRIAHWLFDDSDPLQVLPNLQGFHAHLRAHFDPTGVDPSKGVGGVNAYLAARLTPPVTLSHAQCVQLYHVLFSQEDVRLVAPYDVSAQPW